jgi:hypothetical protein
MQGRGVGVRGVGVGVVVAVGADIGAFGVVLEAGEGMLVEGRWGWLLLALALTVLTTHRLRVVVLI